MTNKKAMTALVSTILLIGFAAVLGLVVMGWGTSMIEDAPSECSKVSLSISTQNGRTTVVPKINNVICTAKEIEIEVLS